MLNAGTSASSLSKVVGALALLLTAGCGGEEREPLQGAACVEGEAGRRPGDAAEDFGLADQHGELVILSDYCGKVVLLQMGAMWCPQCQDDAQAIVPRLETHGDELVILNLLVENGASDPPRQIDLEAWAEHFEITTPVLADKGWAVWERYFASHATPRAILLGRDGRIRVIDRAISEDEIEAALAE